jgi:[acyl-carrier-protein] S-malonyltransferase
MLTGFIFPAFVSEYKGDEHELLRQYSDDIDHLLKEASLKTGFSLTKFYIKENDFRDHELEAQYISYIFGCAVSDILKRKEVTPDYISSYSMGLYSALYCGGSISFAGGLDLIRKAFELIKGVLRTTDTGMGSIVGLERNDILKLLSNKSGVTIANANGIYSYMISGIRSEIEEVLELARLEGALHTSLMNVTCPYHTPLLDEASRNFMEFVEKEVVIKDSGYRIVSGIDQRTFSEKKEIIRELSANLNHQINWMKTMEKILNLKVNRFIECGAGTSLYKIGKFIEGDFRIITLSELGKVIEV